MLDLMRCPGCRCRCSCGTKDEQSTRELHSSRSQWRQSAHLSTRRSERCGADCAGTLRPRPHQQPPAPQLSSLPGEAALPCDPTGRCKYLSCSLGPPTLPVSAPSSCELWSGRQLIRGSHTRAAVPSPQGVFVAPQAWPACSARAWTPHRLPGSPWPLVLPTAETGGSAWRLMQVAGTCWLLVGARGLARTSISKSKLGTFGSVGPGFDLLLACWLQAP